MNTESQNSKMAVTSLVLGILSLCLGILTGLPAIITGHIAHRRARRRPDVYGGAGLAIAGFITGYFSILVTIVALVGLGIALPAFSQARNAAQRARDNAMADARTEAGSVKCVNNMKMLGLAFRIWATDHGDQFPFNVAAAQGGTREACDRDPDGYDTNAAKHFQIMANELGTPKILVCPSDSWRQEVDSFADLLPENVSYELRTGPEIVETSPGEMLARCPIHGHELFCDGSVQARR